MADTDELFRRLTAPGRAAGARRLLRPRPEREGARPRRSPAASRCSAWASRPARRTAGRTPAWASPRRRERIVAMAKTAVDGGKQVQVSVQSAFGCGFEGRVAEERVLDIVRALRRRRAPDDQPRRHGGPRVPRRRWNGSTGSSSRSIPASRPPATSTTPTALGMANIYAALRAGVDLLRVLLRRPRRLPVHEGRRRQRCTEDLVHTLQRMGERTDVDLGALIDVARDVAAFFGREMPGASTGPGPPLS